MKMKESKKKMRRLMMCQSIVDATTSCMIPADYVNNHRSLIRSSRRLSSTDDDQKLVNAKYIRLADHQWRGYGVQPCRRSSSAVSTGNSLVKVDQNANNQVFQVVVMRVSIHCQGCAGKVKKHLSKMEGVTSFSIDLETKRVTVMGHLSPVAVLESMSKVKKAEFWSR